MRAVWLGVSVAAAALALTGCTVTCPEQPQQPAPPEGAHAFPARMADLNAVLILAKAQGKQDAGYTWGRALGSAEKMYRKLGGSE